MIHRSNLLSSEKNRILSFFFKYSLLYFNTSSSEGRQPFMAPEDSLRSRRNWKLGYSTPVLATVPAGNHLFYQEKNGNKKA
jgi:hypothetical protein